MFALAAGCGESTPLGCAKDTDCAEGRICNAGVCENASSSGGGGGGGGGATTSSSSGGGVMCTPGQQTQSECLACFQCIFDNRCVEEKTACENNSACKALRECLDLCSNACDDAPDYGECYDECGLSDSNPTSCANEYPSGVDLNGAIALCQFCAQQGECVGCMDPIPDLRE